MSASIVRTIAPLFLLAGLASVARAGDLPPCHSDLGLIDPDPIGGGGCSVELFVRPGPQVPTSLSLARLPLARGVTEYSFEVVLDRRELEMPEPTDWFRVLVVQTRRETERARYWAIDVNRSRGPGSGMRLVEYSSNTGSDWTIVSSIGLAPPTPCTRIEVTWRRAVIADGHSTLAWYVSNPDSCDPLDDEGRVRTFVFADVGLLQAAEVGSLALVANELAGGKVTANLIDH